MITALADYDVHVPVVLGTDECHCGDHSEDAVFELAAACQEDARAVAHDQVVVVLRAGRRNGPAQANGQGIKSFDGTWYVLNPAGQPITSKSRGGGGY